jgi:hypothetical protein
LLIKIGLIILGYKSPSNLIEFFKNDIDLEEELEKFEGEFEKDEIVEV